MPLESLAVVEINSSEQVGQHCWDHIDWTVLWSMATRFFAGALWSQVQIHECEEPATEVQQEQAELDRLLNGQE